MAEERELYQVLGRMEGTLEGILREQHRISCHIITISDRLQAVEQRQSNMLGWASGAGALAAAVLTFIVKVFGLR